MEQGISIIDRKAEMYEMIMALESDFITNFSMRLTINDIPEKVITHSNKSDNIDGFVSMLQGIGFQAYIEICNNNIDKLNINIEHRNFLNKEFTKIIPIRNNVMHPRPLGVFDYPMLKQIFYSIDQYLDFFCWDNVKSIRTKIIEHPEELRLPPANLKKSNDIIENIPTTMDYEETSFIGRDKEIGQLKALLHKRNVHILCIIGDGGIGKTATAVKLLYDILDDDSFNYELILWVSLKTNSLNKYEFSEIKNSISTISGVYEKLGDFVANKDVEDIPSYLIELAQCYNTLLVLDNLETINTSEIKEFLDSFTEYGQVLMTSRIGLGEMEHRYKLEGMVEKDVMTYMDILLRLYGLEAVFTDLEKKDIATNKLYSNPLAIKWFVRCLYNKQSVDEILKNRTELADFCMSNVYDKLSDLAHRVLDVLIVAAGEISFAELMYYMDCREEDFTNITFAVNDLIKCNFVEDSNFKQNKKLSITNFANDFLRTLTIDNRKLMADFKQKEAKLQAFSQQLLQSRHRSPYTMKSFNIRNNDRSQIIAAYYLMEAISLSYNKEIEKAHLLVGYAKKLSPNYFECNKVDAFIYGTTSQVMAKQEYEIAITNCKDEDELVKMLIVYAGFLLRCNDYMGALDKLDKAKEIDPNIAYLSFERSKVLSCINRFEEAEKVLDDMDISSLSERNQNIFYTRKADIYRRKSEMYDVRDSGNKFILLKNAFEALEKSTNPDKGVYTYMGVLLRALSFLYYDDEAIQYILEKLEHYYTQIRREKSFKDFQIKMREKLEYISNSKLKLELTQYLEDYNEISKSLSDNQGIIYNLDKERKFGFFKNTKYPGGVYFKISNEEKDIQIGNIVEFDNVIETERGNMVQYYHIVK